MAKTPRKQGKNVEKLPSEMSREELHRDLRERAADLRQSAADKANLGKTVRAMQIRCQLIKGIANMSDREVLALHDEAEGDEMFGGHETVSLIPFNALVGE